MCPRYSRGNFLPKAGISSSMSSSNRSYTAWRLPRSLLHGPKRQRPILAVATEMDISELALANGRHRGLLAFVPTLGLW